MSKRAYSVLWLAMVGVASSGFCRAAAAQAEVGVANGLWVSDYTAGSMRVEAIVKPGTGARTLTGIGEDHTTITIWDPRTETVTTITRDAQRLIKESFENAVAWVEEEIRRLGLPGRLANQDIRVHLSDIAAVKDGPSSGAPHTDHERAPSTNATDTPATHLMFTPPLGWVWLMGSSHMGWLLLHPLARGGPEGCRRSQPFETRGATGERGRPPLAVPCSSLSRS